MIRWRERKGESGGGGRIEKRSCEGVESGEGRREKKKRRVGDGEEMKLVLVVMNWVSAR